MSIAQSLTTATKITTLTAAFLLALTACGGSDSATTEAEAAVPTTEAAEVTEAPASDDGDKADEDAKPAEATPSTTPATDKARPASTPVAATSSVSTCSAAQGADGGEYFVVGIAANDSDGGLVARASAGADAERRGVLPQMSTVGTYVDSVDFASCLVSNGSVWWEIHHASLPAGGWVNAAYLEPAADDHVDQPESDEAEDAHGDCVVLPDLPETCTVAFYVGDTITFVDPLSADMNGEFQYACVYQGFGPACDVLAYFGPGDGVGNSLSQAPTAALQDDCANLTGVDKKLACAELATR